MTTGCYDGDQFKHHDWRSEKYDLRKENAQLREQLQPLPEEQTASRATSK
jgi:hypothetical protein